MAAPCRRKAQAPATEDETGSAGGRRNGDRGPPAGAIGFSRPVGLAAAIGISIRRGGDGLDSVPRIGYSSERGGTRGPGAWKPLFDGLVPAVTAPESLTARSGSLRCMSRRPGAKGRRDRSSTVFQLPDYGWSRGLVCGGVPQT